LPASLTWRSSKMCVLLYKPLLLRGLSFIVCFSEFEPSETGIISVENKMVSRCRRHCSRCKYNTDFNRVLVYNCILARFFATKWSQTCCVQFISRLLGSCVFFEPTSKTKSLRGVRAWARGEVRFFFHVIFFLDEPSVTTSVC
jgi:hypothetical protein